MLHGSVGIPKVHVYSTEGNYNVLVMDLLGSSLEDLLKNCGGQFSLKTTLMLAEQMLEKIELLHRKELIHRDIKPSNFLMDVSKHSPKLYMIDFGMSKRYITLGDKEVPKEHIEYRDGKSFIGTPRFASANVHQGVE